MCVWQSHAPTGTSKSTGVDGCDAFARAIRVRMVTPRAIAPSSTLRRVNIGFSLLSDLKQPLIACLAVHHFLEGLAVKESAQIIDKEARNDFVALRVRAADMGQYDDPLGGPERMVGGQRLLPKHVQHRASDLLCLHRGDQVVVLDQ